MTNYTESQARMFWDNVHTYENSIPKRDQGLYDELMFIDGVLYCDK